MEKLLLQHARILDPSSNLDVIGDLLLEDGLLKQVGGTVEAPDAQVFDAKGLVAAPGLVDMHVHLRDPGFTEKEDIFTGCRAAAAGGVTSLLCSNELDDLEALREAGAIALSDDGRPVVDSRLMARAMRAAPGLGMRVVSHCEDLDLSKGGLMNEGDVSRELGVPGVPAAAEDCGTARDIALAEAYQVPIHICHVSSRTSVAMIRDAKRRGVQVTAETAPHYFSLTDAMLRARDADFRMSPPLRTESDRLAVIEGLRDGTIDAIATDHAPHTPAEKADFSKAPNGSIGMETSLAAGITYLVKTGLLTLRELLRLMSTAPANLLHIPAGTLNPGAPADIVLFDPEEQWTVEPEKLHGKSRNAVFKGRILTGRVKLTVCRGKIVYRGGNEGRI